MTTYRTLLLVTLLGAALQPAMPHSGGTNADGCHTDHRTGEYHCHTPKTPSANTVSYCHVVNGEHRCGYSFNSCQNLVSSYGGFCQRD
jgi:hypothetical protein